MQRIASTRHTIIVLAIFAVLAVAGYRANAHRTAGEVPNHFAIYAGVLIGQLLLVRYVMIGLRGVTVRDLIGRRWSSVGDVVFDVLLAAAVWFGQDLMTDAVKHLLGVVDNHAAGLLPRNALELALWIPLSIVAGFCEELVFRGYLQRQFAALTHSMLVGVILQAIVFGVSHGYQGIRSTAVITTIGLLYGVIAWWRKSLIPGMLTHAWTDVIAGLVR